MQPDKFDRVPHVFVSSAHFVSLESDRAARRTTELKKQCPPAASECAQGE